MKKLQKRAQRVLGLPEPAKIANLFAKMNERMNAQDELAETTINACRSAQADVQALAAEIAQVKRFTAELLTECVTRIPNFKGLSDDERRLAVSALLNARSKDEPKAEEQTVGEAR
jgi:hypothetical protein